MYIFGLTCPAIPLNDFIACHMFCHFPLVFIYLYKNSTYVYATHQFLWEQIKYNRQKVLYFYMKGMTKNRV